MPTTGLDVEQKKGRARQQHVKRSLNTDRLCGCGSMRESTAENPAIQDIFRIRIRTKYREVSTLQQRLQFRRERVPTVCADD